MKLRPYNEQDAEPTLRVFLRAIRETASGDYSPAQVAAWASEEITVDDWNTNRRAHTTQVAEDAGEVIGFTDVSATGYIDMMFVSPDAVRQGVASSLLEWATQTAIAAGATELTTHASITAQRFFTARGFATDEQRFPVVRGVQLTNFAMSCPLPH